MTSEETITRELKNQGWQKQFVAAEPRLSEAVEMYKELGFQVHLEPLPALGKTQEEGCYTCFDGVESQYSTIFTKPAEKTSQPCSD